MPAPTRLPLKRKVEAAFVAFVRRARADGRLSDDYGVTPGHADEEPPMPYLAVCCSALKETDDLPTGSGVKEGEVVFGMKTVSSDEARATADARLLELEEVLGDVAYVQSVVNITAEAADNTDLDLRSITGFHLTALDSDQDAEEQNGEAWLDQVIRRVVVEAVDHEPAA